MAEDDLKRIAELETMVNQLVEVIKFLATGSAEYVHKILEENIELKKRLNEQNPAVYSPWVTAIPEPVYTTTWDMTQIVKRV